MASHGKENQSSDSQVLAASIRGLRLLRGLSSRETATGMNLSLRTYQDFEAGRGRLNLDYVSRFCRVVDADPDAIIGAIMIGSPRFAINCADNKLMRMVMIGVNQLDRRLGDRVTALEARSIMAAVDTAVRELVDRAIAEDAARWLNEGNEEIARARPRPGR
ncbi:helix-turn-helix domain-containing protein [Brevundimonas naejangsanensis]|uniref:helix-turn-helix domain-containing protein n=1 Tax=Brevundimonas naejangsanensis TaxID=588932 RepID=UPI001069190C|nr:helix-turn-helix transcriptional regulator [Brevundimonas naejangsanensis]QBQ47309.1 XRE family transcriptional regulator [Brevundimonas naejangsanensis]